MKKMLTCFLLLTGLSVTHSQDIYKDSLKAYISNYINTHEVVTGDDRQYLPFYPVDKAYNVTATFKPVSDGKWFTMETSGTIKKTFQVYGKIEFRIHDTTLTLNIYQSQSLMQLDQYKDLLFLPFTDLTSGEETYAAGRYIDLSMKDIKGNKLVIDFNKAYNPYCAYVSGKYNCPIPPKENQLPIAVLAGEKLFGKPH